MKTEVISGSGCIDSVGSDAGTHVRKRRVGAA